MRTVEDVGYVVILLIGVGIGIYLGLHFGGRLAMRRLTESEHEVRLSRSGLKK
jgi:hypothetical protein